MHKTVVRIINYLALSMCLLAITACGQKGDLYEPEQSSMIKEVHTLHV